MANKWQMIPCQHIGRVRTYTAVTDARQISNTRGAAGFVSGAEANRGPHGRGTAGPEARAPRLLRFIPTLRSLAIN